MLGRSTRLRACPVSSREQWPVAGAQLAHALGYPPRVAVRQASGDSFIDRRVACGELFDGELSESEIILEADLSAVRDHVGGPGDRFQLAVRSRDRWSSHRSQLHIDRVRALGLGARDQHTHHPGRCWAPSAMIAKSSCTAQS